MKNSQKWPKSLKMAEKPKMAEKSEMAEKPKIAEKTEMAEKPKMAEMAQNLTRILSHFWNCSVLRDS